MFNGIFCQHQFPLWSQLGSWAGCPSQIISRLNYIRANVSPSQSWDSDSNFKQIWTQKMNLKSFRLCFCLVYQYLFYILQKYLYIYNTIVCKFVLFYITIFLHLDNVKPGDSLYFLCGVKLYHKKKMTEPVFLI